MPGDLKPCPFCGSTELRTDYIRDGSVVRCRKCMAEGPAHFQPDASVKAIAAWNRRAPSEAGLVPPMPGDLVVRLRDFAEFYRKHRPTKPAGPGLSMAEIGPHEAENIAEHAEEAADELARLRAVADAARKVAEATKVEAHPMIGPVHIVPNADVIALRAALSSTPSPAPVVTEEVQLRRERVAQAIYEAEDGDKTPWESLFDAEQREYLRLADAAIAALTGRTP